MDDKTKTNAQEAATASDTPTKRDAFLSYLKTQHPDHDFDDDDVLYDRLQSDYDERTQLLGDRGKLITAMQANPKFASFIVDASKGQDPIVALVNMVGSEELLAYLNDEEKAEAIKAANQAYLERIAKDNEFTSEFETNTGKTGELIDQLIKSGKYTDEQIDKAITILGKTLDERLRGIITEDTIALMLKADQYEADIEKAQKEAEIRAKNKEIEERKLVQPNTAAAQQQQQQQQDMGRLPELMKPQQQSAWARGGYKKK